MTLTGRVENGAIVLDEPAELPEGAKVEVRVVQTAATGHHPVVEQLAGLLKDATDAELDNARAEHHEYLLRKHS